MEHDLKISEDVADGDRSFTTSL